MDGAFHQALGRAVDGHQNRELGAGIEAAVGQQRQVALADLHIVVEMVGGGFAHTFVNLDQTGRG